MIDSFLINKTFFLLVNFIGIWLAIWVFFSNRKAKLNQLFLLMTIFILLWINFSYTANLQVNYSHFLFKLSFGAISLFLITAYFFLLSFPKKEKKYPHLLYDGRRNVGSL